MQRYERFVNKRQQEMTLFRYINSNIELIFKTAVE